MTTTCLRYVTLDATGTLLRPRARIGATYVERCLRLASATPVASSEPSSSRREALEHVVDARFPRVFKETAREFPNFGRDLLSGATAAPWWSHVILSSLPDELMAALLPEKQRRLTTELFEYYASGDAWTVFDEVVPALETLRARGVRMGVISDFDERLPRILQDLKLEQFFDVVTTSWAFGETKPSRAVFHHTFQALAGGAYDPREFLHIGDHVGRDYDGAVDAGAQARLLARQGLNIANSVGQTRHVVATLADIVPLLE